MRWELIISHQIDFTYYMTVFESYLLARSPVFLREKTGVTPSVAAPGDINPMTPLRTTMTSYLHWQRSFRWATTWREVAGCRWPSPWTWPSRLLPPGRTPAAGRTPAPSCPALLPRAEPSVCDPQHHAQALTLLTDCSSRSLSIAVHS